MCHLNNFVISPLPQFCLIKIAAQESILSYSSSPRECLETKAKGGSFTCPRFTLWACRPRVWRHKCCWMQTQTAEGWEKKERSEQNWLERSLQGHCNPLCSSVHSGTKPNLPLQFTGTRCVYLLTEFGPPRSSGSAGQKPLSGIFWAWVSTVQLLESEDFAAYFSASEYREMTAIFLWSWLAHLWNN